MLGSSRGRDAVLVVEEEDNRGGKILGYSLSQCVSGLECCPRFDSRQQPYVGAIDKLLLFHLLFC